MQTTPKSNGTAVLTLMRAPDRGPDPTIPISESTARLLGATAVLAIALVHILDAVSTYHGTRWIFWSYMAVIVASVPIVLLLLHSASPLAWGAAAGVAAGPLLGYLWSRTIGLPGDRPDIGNWLCTLGMAALFVESSLLALSATRLAIWRRTR
ncbi:MAG: hypothetical protein JOY58_05125 [Solirubrobacterales bacterium]|nr:hypothetical protein [Solirubrobacterales bacterium]